MNRRLYILGADSPQMLTPEKEALTALESGKILFLPNLTFKPDNSEQLLLNADILDKNHKNISYDYLRQQLKGVSSKIDIHNNQGPAAITKAFMHRFAEFTQEILTNILPEYIDYIKLGRTSYRPAQIKTRIRSKRQDDTRLHVDSFPATPVNGLRILRIFCNIHPDNEPRVWNIGEPFTDVLGKFANKIPEYKPKRAKFLKLIKATKTLRTPYDHYMLKLHDKMKLDNNYQNNATKIKIDFPANSTWIVFTDHVSHAALSGQFLLEQTFYLPVNAMQSPGLSPLKEWGKIRKLEIS